MAGKQDRNKLGGLSPEEYWRKLNMTEKGRMRPPLKYEYRLAEKKRKTPKDHKETKPVA